MLQLEGINGRFTSQHLEVMPNQEQHSEVSLLRAVFAPLYHTLPPPFTPLHKLSPYLVLFISGRHAFI